MRDLKGKVAVVTGAGSGIGRATSIALAAKGSTVAACDLDEAAAKETTQMIIGSGGYATAHRVDVSDEEDMRRLVDAVLGEHGVVDVVVNNAGIMEAPTRAVDISLDRFRKMMAVNLWGEVYGSLMFLPYLLGRPEANLVNVSSNAGLMAYTRMASYSASKFAVRGFSESLRMELTGSPVHVTVVYPGSTKTSLAAHSPLMEESQRHQMQQSFSRAWGRPPENVARAIVAAILKNKPRAVVGPDTTVIDAIVRLFPGAYSRLLARSVEKFLDWTLGAAR